jgi:hypothetical protein
MSLSAGCLPSCGPGGGPPKPDSCSNGSADGIDAVTISGPADDSFFTGDFPRLAMGGQGATMVVLRIHIAGPNPPSCLAQSTTALSGISPNFVFVGHDNTPRATYAQPDGTRATRDMYIVLDTLANEVRTIVGSHTVFQMVGGSPLDLSASRPLDMAHVSD